MKRMVDSPVAAAENELSQRWRALMLPSALVFVAFAFLMFETFSSLTVLWWHSQGYGHGLLVLAVCAYLIYRRRDELAAVSPRASVLGLVLTCGLVSVWFASRILSVLIGEQVIMVLMLVSLTLALYGRQTTRIIGLPVLYLFCAVPLWSYLVPWLQSTTAQFATRISRALGVPVYLEGIHMTIPNGVFLVAEVCAGISYLLAALSLGAFYALLNLRGPWTRIALVALAIGAGLVFNWIRVAIIVLAGHYLDMQHALVREHVMFGWFLFVLVVLFLMFCGRFLERIEERRQDKPQHVADSRDETALSKRRSWSMAIVCALVVSVPAYASLRFLSLPQHPASVSLPEQLGRASGWRAGTAPSDGWAATFFGPDSEARASYTRDGQYVEVQIGYFAVQRQGSEAANDYHTFFDHKKWRRVSQKAVADQVAVAAGLTVNELWVRRRKSSANRLVWWWYWVDQQFTADPVETKILQIRSLFSGNREAAIIVLSSPISDNVVKTRDGMKDWLRQTAVPLAASLHELSR